MRVSSSQKLNLLAIIGSHLGILYVATAFTPDRCGYYDRRYFGRVHDWRCNPRLMPRINSCFDDEHICNVFPDFRDCLLPQFQCFVNGRCIPRSHYCNGIIDCSDGSDEWGCDTTSSDSTITSTMRSVEKTPSEIAEKTPSYMTTTSTRFRGYEEQTTSVIYPESEQNTALPSSTTTSTIISPPESNTVRASSTTTSSILPKSGSKTVLSSSTTTSTMFAVAESKTLLSSSTTASTMLPDSESNTALPSSTTTSTMFAVAKSKTLLSSSTTASTMLPDAESNTVLPPSTTTKTMILDTTSETLFPSFVAENTMLPEHEEKTSSPITNTIFPDSSAMQSCPNNYCIRHAECIVVQGQYRCKCPPSYIGDHCEIQLGTKQGSHENSLAIVLFMTLIVLCLAIASAGIYRYKRLSARKSNYVTSRTLSQLTLISNDVA